MQDVLNVFVKYLCGIIFFLLCAWISVSFSALHLASLCMSCIIFWIWVWVSQMIQFVMLGLIRSSMSLHYRFINDSSFDHSVDHIEDPFVNLIP